jgi:hypothetical protein
MLDIAGPLKLRDGVSNRSLCGCVDITVDLVGCCVGENERGFHPNGGYRAYKFGIGSACVRLAVRVVIVCGVGCTQSLR